MAKWYADWQKLRFTIEEKLQPMIARGLKGDIEAKEEQETPIIMQAIYVLNDYKIAVDNFYLEERKNIYQQYVFQIVVICKKNLKWKKNSMLAL